MRINKRVATALCCKLWGISIKEFNQQVKDGDIRLHDVLSTAMVEIATHPFSAEALTEMLLPGRALAQKQAKHDAINNETFQQLIELKKQAQAKQEQQQQEPIEEKPIPKEAKRKTINIKR